MSSRNQATLLGEEKVSKLLPRFYFPAIVATTSTALYNIVDRIFIGQYCGEDALAAITICFSPSLIFLALGMLIGHGSAALVSIKLGEHHKICAEKILGQSILLFILLSAFIAFVAFFFLDEILHLFGATEQIFEYAKTYYFIILLGIFFEEISFGVNNTIRAEGHPYYSMATMLIGASLNVFLDYLFIVKFSWGIKGAAYATVIAQAVASIWVMYFYMAKCGLLLFRFKNLRIFPSLLKEMLKIGSPSFIVQFLAGGVVGLMIVQAGKYGDNAGITVMGVVMTVNLLVFMPILGVTTGAQPIMGYNWGAKKFDRVSEALKITLITACSFSILGFLFTQSFPKLIFSIFLGDTSKNIDLGISAMRIMTAAFIFIGLNFTVAGFFQSTGRPKFSIFLTVLRQVIALAPMLIFLPHIFGLTGLWVSFPLSDFVTALYSGIVVYKEFKALKMYDTLIKTPHLAV